MMRVGQGYDAHRLAENRRLVIGGVEIPFEKGLLGHSDADVLTHAVIDALFGAAALGNIGSHFPDSDPRYAGADSIGLLAEAAALLREAGWRVVNIDSTVVAQAPRLGPWLDAMRARLAAAVGVGTDCVSVKAKTEESMGFTGTGEGMSAQAVCLIEKDCKAE
jgi:2-C-methyl-D-erythritol 2,4-cyclodiphosphate synthase